MATVPLGVPAITPPTALDIKSIRAALSATRQRIEALERLVSGAQSEKDDALQAQINALRTQLTTLTARVVALEEATVSVTEATNTDLVTLIADEDIGQFCAVVGAEYGRIVAARGSELIRVSGVLGVTVASAAADNEVVVRRRGPLEVVGAVFTPGLAVYADVDGALTQVPSYETMSLPIGLATGEAEVWVQPGWPALYSLAFAETEVPYTEFMPVTYRLVLDAVADAQGQRVLYDDTGRALLTVNGQEIFVGA
jgi:hypothetical protein